MSYILPTKMPVRDAVVPASGGVIVWPPGTIAVPLTVLVSVADSKEPSGTLLEISCVPVTTGLGEQRQGQRVVPRSQDGPPTDFSSS